VALTAKVAFVALEALTANEELIALEALTAQLAVTLYVPSGINDAVNAF
jgi:hypothetical protein